MSRPLEHLELCVDSCMCLCPPPRREALPRDPDLSERVRGQLTLTELEEEER